MGGVFLACSGLLTEEMSAQGNKQDKKRDPTEIGNRKVDGGPNFFSLEKEMALGRMLALEVENQAKLFDDPLVTEYLNRLCQNVVRHSDVTFPVTIRLIENEVPNAFTLPGGHIFVHTGLVRLSATEAELAAAIAHEVGHVAARHATRQATQSKIADAATIPLILFGGPVGLAVRNAAAVGVPMTFMKFSRVFEAEADMLGLQYLYDAGYDPSASIDIFERLEAMQKKKPGTVAQIFSSHPMTADRIQKAEQDIRDTLPARSEYVVNTSDYEHMRMRMGRILDSHQTETSTERKPTLLKQGEQPSKP